MTTLRPGHHVYAERIGNVSIAAFSADGKTVSVDTIATGGRSTSLNLLVANGLTLLPTSPVPLDWTAAVYTQSGRPFIFNSKGMGRCVEQNAPNPKNNGRQMWYGWLDHYANEGCWYYEDGTPARGTAKGERLTNVEPTRLGYLNDGSKVTLHAAPRMLEPDSEPQQFGYFKLTGEHPKFRDRNHLYTYRLDGGLVISNHAFTVSTDYPFAVGQPVKVKDDATVGLHAQFVRGARGVVTNATKGNTYVEVLFNGTARCSVPLTMLEPSPMLDHTKPIVTNDGRVFTVLGLFAPLVGDGPDHIAGTLSTGNSVPSILFVDRATGKVVPRYSGDAQAKALTFSNGPIVTRDRIQYQVEPNGPVATIIVTITDGVVSDVNLRA